MAGSEDIAKEVGVVTSTIRRWADLGLLPTPQKVHRGRRGTSLVFPEEAIKQAVWVKAQLDAGRTVSDLQAALRDGEYPPRSQAGEE